MEIKIRKSPLLAEEGIYSVATRKGVLIENCLYRRSFAFRLRGLMGKKRLPSGSGILLDPCKGIHTFFMRFPITAIFIDDSSNVIAVFHNIKPYRATPFIKGAAAVLEINSTQELDYTVEKGERLIFKNKKA